MARAQKGTVTILASRGRLQLRWRHGGKRYYLSLGFPDTKANRKLAQAKAKTIESDMAYERFDLTLERYRPDAEARAAQFTASSLPKLWELYMVHRKPLSAHTTIIWQYRSAETHINNLKAGLDDIPAMVTELQANQTPEVAHRTLIQIRACCKWAARQGLLPRNPFSGPIEIPKPKKARAIRPFTKQEIQAILGAFEGMDLHPLIRFYFLTGCRTGEALGLRWGDVAPDCTSIYIVRSFAGGEFSDTKTHKSRRFPCGPELQRLLKSLRPDDPGDALVFPDVTQKRLWYQWKRRIGQLTEDGVVQQYRPQYNTRHTFITRALEAGIPITQVAEWAGNSPKIILERYAGILGTYLPPEL